MTALELDRGEVRLEARVLVGRKSAEKEVSGLTLGRHACVPLRHPDSVRPAVAGATGSAVHQMWDVGMARPARLELTTFRSAT